MKDGNSYEICQTFRTKCGRGRVTYRPDWSDSKPWASYVNGTAGIHFTLLYEAKAYFEQTHKMKLITESE